MEKVCNFMSVTPVSQFYLQPAHDKQRQDNMKRKVLATAALGSAAAFGVITHKQGFKISNLPKTPVKDWAIFKIKGKTLKIEEPEVIGLAGGSVVGGLAGGALFDDKSNMKAKFREALSQMLGNVAIPILCVGQTSKFYKRHEEDILKHVPTIKGENKGFVKYANRAMKAVPPVALTGVALGAGIIAGNRVSNFINEKISGKKVEREIRGTDFAPHVDDLCLAITLMAPGTPVGEVIAKTIPFFLTVPGYQTGIAGEGREGHHH